MHSQPQLSAHATHHDVEPNEKSLRAILRATSTLYPQYQVVGDFHSHPYDDSALLEESKGWEFTEGDEEANIDLVRTMSDLGHSIETTFIIGIARSGKRVERRHYRGRENTMQLSLGECRVIIAAYRSLESGRYSGRNIRLRLPGI